MSAKIQALYLYPIKGCRGFAVDEAMLAPTGLEVDGIGDREWVVVDEENDFLSQRELPRMALIETRLTPSSLRIKAPGMLALDIPLASEGDVVSVRVWNDTVSAVTQDPLIDTWLTNFLGRPARLMRFDPEHRRLAPAKFTGKHEATYKFADAFPMLVTTQASLEDLKHRWRFGDPRPPCESLRNQRTRLLSRAPSRRRGRVVRDRQVPSAQQ